MNIYNKSTLITFYTKHSDCRNSLEKWYNDVLSKEWSKPSDVTRDFNTSRAIKNNRVIFKINENDYRLIVEINYEKEWLFIKFIGSHQEYDKIDPTMINKYRTKK